MTNIKSMAYFLKLFSTKFKKKKQKNKKQQQQQQQYLTTSKIREVSRLFLNSFKISTKYRKMRQFYRKYFLKNDSFFKKHYCRNKQSVINIKK